MTPKRLFILIGIPALALILILTAVLIPVSVHMMRRVPNPVAQINLSNGMVLEFEIFEDEVPIAATTFIFLARIGFFDGSIIHDVQRGFARFGGFYNEEFEHRQNDEVFRERHYNRVIGRHPNAAAAHTNPFAFRIGSGRGTLPHNTSTAGSVQQRGWLSFMVNDGATEFQMALRDGADLFAGNSRGRQNISGALAFARALNQRTMDNLHQLNMLWETTDANGNRTLVREDPNISFWWLPRETIRISSIRFYNLGRSRWTPDPNGELTNNPLKWTDTFHFTNWKQHHNVSWWQSGLAPER